MSAYFTKLYEEQLAKFNEDQITYVLTIFIAFFMASILVRKLRSTTDNEDTKSSSSSQKAVPGVLRDYTMAEIAQHNAENDFWLVIKHKDTGRLQVYDLTDYVDEHPGGEIILNHGGKDATKAFIGVEIHPPTVWDLIKEYHIGYVTDGRDE